MSWSASETEETTLYKVVVNHEDQYSIWPAGRDNPLGWMDGGKAGPKNECLAYIKAAWTDMRPLSLRKQMEAGAKSARAAAPGSSAQPHKDDLVKRLSEGDHPVAVILERERSGQALKQAIDRAYVHIKFMDTNGGTGLGVRLDGERTDLSQGDFEGQTGSVHLVGALTLDYVEVRFVADVNLSTLAGTGHLEPVR
jgi:uncharacterized protein YbdZ (MbtH family)